jgi:outer membrane protein OmpA-like peptidoglycan-associated protein
VADGEVYASNRNNAWTHNSHFKTGISNIRDIHHDTETDLLWVVGDNIKVFNWNSRDSLMHLNKESKPVFVFEQSETICPIVGTKKVLIGTRGSGIILVEFGKKDSVSPPTSLPPIASKENIDTNQIPKPKPPINLSTNIFVLKNFEKDSTTLSPLDMIPFFRNIDENIDFKQVEIKKVKIEGHASKTGEGSDKTKTKEISQKRIKFVRQKLTKKYKLTEEIFEEHNYGDENPIDRKRVFIKLCHLKGFRNFK